MHALINSSGQIVDLVMWDGGQDWAPPAGLSAVPVPAGAFAAIGGHYLNGEFSAPAGPAPSIEERKGLLVAAVQGRLDAEARALGYDDMRSAVTYADEPAAPQFQAEGQALRAWRSLVWAACYEKLAQWQAGEIQEPNANDLIGSLPEFAAPT